ncbi:MAG: type IV pilus assembly protein PilO, partial [Halieaceae bacterium]
MAFSPEAAIKSLQEFDLNDLDIQNIGSWPIAVKLIVWTLVMSAVVTLGYVYHIKGMQEQLVGYEGKEAKLRLEYEEKSFKAANLDAYKKQMVVMEESFGALVSQLPSDTEVPGLLEDITNKGMVNGLEFSSISLGAEETREFYVELPIYIQATGKYHDLGAFVSGMAGIPRIVTLHDFTIGQNVNTFANSNQSSGILSLNITA